MECIFLTAHADFSYAREAVALGGFDYILQSAKYEEIETAICKAGQKVAAKTENAYYSKYGKLLHTKKDQLVNDVLKSWLFDKSMPMGEAIRDLEQMQILLPENSLVYCVMIHVIKSQNCEYENLNYDMLRYAFVNILNELFQMYGGTVLVSQFERDRYCGLIICREQECVTYKNVVDLLEQFQRVSKEGLKCNITCYAANGVTVHEISNRMDLLQKISQDDVGKYNSIVRLEDYHKGESVLHDVPNLKTGSRCL